MIAIQTEFILAIVNSAVKWAVRFMEDHPDVTAEEVRAAVMTMFNEVKLDELKEKAILQRDG